MIEILHPTPAQGVIPISTVLAEVDAFAHEVGNVAPRLIYEQIEAIVLEIGHIKGETTETITNNPNGSFTINETGYHEAMSVSVGFGTATANATASSTGSPSASARAETVAAATNGLADSVAVAFGDIVSATTSI